MIKLEELQKQFSLFAIGDVEKVTVIAAGETVKVRTLGGCLGILDETDEITEKLETGSALEVEVIGFFDDNLPIFKITESCRLTRREQPARVLFAGPRGVVVSFNNLPDVQGVYAPIELPLELRNLKPNQDVMASEIVRGEKYYCIKKLVPIDVVAEERKKVTDIMSPWSKEQVETAIAAGSRKMWGEVKLGKVYLATFYTNKEVKFKDGQVGFLEKGKLPDNAQKVWVRVIMITESKRVSVELIKVDCENKTVAPLPDAVAEQPQIKLQPQISSATVQLNKRDDKVFFDGFHWQENGELVPSEVKAKGVWLGFTYAVKIKDGVPAFNGNLNKSKSLKPEDNYRLEFIPEVKETVAPYQDGDTVYAQVLHLIFVEGTKNLPDRKCRITLRILEVDGTDRVVHTA